MEAAELTELDRLLAEKVIGYKRIPFYGGTRAKPVAGEYDSMAEFDWRPTRSIEQAMMVFQKMRESHYWCCLSLQSDYDYCWNIRGVKDDKDGEKHEWYDLVGYSVEEDSPALAICLAAKAWLEAKSPAVP